MQSKGRGGASCICLWRSHAHAHQAGTRRKHSLTLAAHELAPLTPPSCSVRSCRQYHGHADGHGGKAGSVTQMDGRAGKQADEHLSLSSQDSPTCRLSYPLSNCQACLPASHQAPRPCCLPHHTAPTDQ